MITVGSLCTGAGGLDLAVADVLGRPAPEPTVVGKRGGRRLSGRFVEWLMGWPEGWVTDLVDNTAALRLCGNGVVRQQGAAAYRPILADLVEAVRRG